MKFFDPRQSRLFLRRSSTNYLFVDVNSTSYARAKNYNFFFKISVSLTLLVLLTMIRSQFAISSLLAYPTGISACLSYKT